MSSESFDIVTGAFGYSGKCITQRLLDAGREVRTLTNSPDRPNPFGGRIKAMPYNFDQPELLTESLRGCEVLYNTYWVRFNHRSFSHADAVANARILFDSAKRAGVQRIVHVSITNPSLDSPLEYFRGKAELEQSLKQTGISHAILRPAILFGHADILVNNIAWALRRLPVFGVFGNGRYRLQPIHVDDFADIAVELGKSSGNVMVNAIGPQTFTYRQLVQQIARIIGKHRLIMPTPPWIGYMVGKVVGWMVGDVAFTRDEITGLMADLLYVDDVPRGKTKLTDWAADNAEILGCHYASELARRKNRKKSYEQL